MQYANSQNKTEDAKIAELCSSSKDIKKQMRHSFFMPKENDILGLIQTPKLKKNYSVASPKMRGQSVHINTDLNDPKNTTKRASCFAPNLQSGGKESKFSFMINEKKLFSTNDPQQDSYQKNLKDQPTPKKTPNAGSHTTKAIVSKLSKDIEESIEIDVKLVRKNSRASSRNNFRVQVTPLQKRKSKKNVEKAKPIKKTGIQIFSQGLKNMLKRSFETDTIDLKMLNLTFSNPLESFNTLFEAREAELEQKDAAKEMFDDLDCF